MDHPIHNHMERSIHNVKTGFATRFIGELEVGTVNVGGAGLSYRNAPFGGIKVLADASSRLRDNDMQTSGVSRQENVAVYLLSDI
jgi:hypothetical protein